ncbi:hypothetical protein BM1_02386 [Bipolaris maydis]|nr:hypothetical protein BM1_02386 [Bipolaris maydis]
MTTLLRIAHNSANGRNYSDHRPSKYKQTLDLTWVALHRLWGEAIVAMDTKALPQEQRPKHGQDRTGRQSVGQRLQATAGRGDLKKRSKCAVANDVQAGM